MSKERSLSRDEAQLWRRVIATVEPLQKGRPVSHDPAALNPGLYPSQKPSKADAERALLRAAMEGKASPLKQTAAKPGAGWTYTPTTPPELSGSLDGQWDARLGKGQVQPEATVDLHGHSLATAHHELDRALSRAITGGLRVVLLITGKPRAPGSGRGAIRAAVADWLSASRHASQIAAVRRAHPRHGGDGALYIVLRRRR